MTDKKSIDLSPGELIPGEAHPAAYDAQRFICYIPLDRLAVYRESLASVALSGNRLADICSETLRRLLDGEPVSDRYILGLAWQLKTLEEENEKRTKKDG